MKGDFKRRRRGLASSDGGTEDPVCVSCPVQSTSVLLPSAWSSSVLLGLLGEQPGLYCFYSLAKIL